MKTTITIKQTLLALTIALSIVSCKKDKKDEPTPPPVEVKAITLTDLKALSTGASVKVPDAKKITGIVISDVSSKNIDSKTVVLQDAASQVGIIVTFDAAQTFAVGDQVEVDISGQTLAQVNGEIELTNVPAAKAKKTGTGTITPKTTTAADIATNKAAWDGTLVTIAATDLTGTTAKYSGTLTIKDASGTVTSAVLAGASFETTDLPPSVSSVTGIVRTGGTDTRVDIRKTADVTTGAITRVLTENFDNITVAQFNIDQGLTKCLNNNFTTAFGRYFTNGAFVKYPGSLYDATFTTAGRDYVYMYHAIPTGTTSESTDKGNLMTNFTNLQGVKTIKITFAGSKANKVDFNDVYNGVGPEGIFDLSSFNEATDYIQIGVFPKSPDDGNYLIANNDISKLVKASEQYKKVGVFYTFTYTVPTKAELTAAGVTSAYADAWLANPNIAIFNYSTPRKGPSSDWGNVAPVLLDKIEFGFGN